ncbi:MAG TPA: hypothetical protein VGD46_21920, partial [Rhizobacter sp.]
MMTTLQTHAYDTKVLVKEVHDRLVHDIENVARMAGIPVPMIWTSATQYCNEDEIDYTRRLHLHAAEGTFGYLYVGKQHGEHPVSMRMMALAGACVRNFINARVMTVQDLLAAVRKDNVPSPTVLLIPNFFVSTEHGGNLPSWQASGLMSVLLNRMAAGQQTYVYVDDLDAMKAQYGDMVYQHLAAYFQRAE